MSSSVSLQAPVGTRVSQLPRSHWLTLDYLLLTGTINTGSLSRLTRTEGYVEPDYRLHNCPFSSCCFLLLPPAYSTFYVVGLVLSMQIPFVGFQPIRTSEHMAAAGESSRSEWLTLLFPSRQNSYRSSMTSVCGCCGEGRLDVLSWCQRFHFKLVMETWFGSFLWCACDVRVMCMWCSRQNSHSKTSFFLKPRAGN